jgi:hypothetical protein
VLTYLFRKESTTLEQVKFADRLIKKIEAAGSVKDLSEILHDASQDAIIKSASSRSHLKKLIPKFIAEIEPIAKEIALLEQRASYRRT